MKKFKNTRSLLLIACFLLFANMQCKKDDGLDADGLPRATQTGERIFACKINGEKWISSTKSRDMGGGISSEIISIRGGGRINDKVNLYESFEIVISNPQNESKFQFEKSKNRYVRYSTFRPCFDETGGYGVAEDKFFVGKVTFTRIDSAAKIISGTFWCNIPTDKCDTIRVTDGRFDIRYY